MDLLIDGEQFYPRMLAALAEAQHEILLEMYLADSGIIFEQFCAALVAAGRRGVRVSLLLDDFGTRGLNSTHRTHLATLHEEGLITVYYYNPLWFTLRWRHYLHRNHRKLLLVDGTCAFVGGMGLSDVFTGPQAWRDTAVMACGPIAADWRRLFAHTWQSTAGISLPPLPIPPTQGEIRCRVAHAQGHFYREIQQQVVQHCNTAQQRIWLATAYFVPSWKLRHALIRASRRGVDVRLLVPGPTTDHPSVRHAGRRFYLRLLRHGVRLFEYQARFTHSKVILCDDWISLGSCNLDRWNLTWNLEANHEVADPAFAAQIADMLQKDYTHSKEITLAEWRQRNLFTRLQENFWGGVDHVMKRWLKV